MRISVFTIIVFCLVLISCSRPAYEKLEDGILVHLKDNATRQVRIQVVSDKIIRVTASPVDSLSHEASLVVLPEAKSSTDWKITEAENKVTLSTQSVNVSVSLLTGEV